MPDAAREALAELVRLHAEFGEDLSTGAPQERNHGRRGRRPYLEPASRKVELLRGLAGATLRSARDVRSLHEMLCFLRAYPDNAEILAEVETQLAAFSQRADLRRFRASFESAGIAGADIAYPFFWPTARWLAERFPERLTIEWDDVVATDRLLDLLPLLTAPAEMPVVDEFDYTPRQWMQLLCRDGETDAAFLVRSFGRIDMGELAKEKLWDSLGVWMRLAPGPGTPSRTEAKHRVPRVSFQSKPLNRSRPDLSRLSELAPKSVKAVSPTEGRALITLARDAMVSRERDLDVFSWGSPEDVRLVDCGDGLQFAAIGAIPSRRLLLESVYGFLTLRNGVPVGYVLSSALFGSSEIAYNVFDTWRGGEAGQVYGRVLAMLQAIFGSDSFVVFPYQLGYHNEEGLKSGAWWFYQKLGFRPKHAGALAIMNDELARMKADPSWRTPVATLRKLADEPVYWHEGAERDDVIGRISLGDVGRRVAEVLTARFGSDRRDGAARCAKEAARLLGVPARWTSAGERWAWEAWGPLALILPGVEGWSAAEKRALAKVISAKGSRRESDFVRLFDRHPKLRAAILQLATP